MNSFEDFDLLSFLLCMDPISTDSNLMPLLSLDCMNTATYEKPFQTYPAFEFNYSPQSVQLFPVSPSNSSTTSFDLHGATVLPFSPNQNLQSYNSPLTMMDQLNYDIPQGELTTVTRPKYHCNDCPKTFGRPQDLRRHITSLHLKEKRFICQKCKKAFSRKDALRRHERTKKY